MARGRKPAAETAAKRAERERAEKAVTAAGEGWELIEDPAELVVEQAKITPFLAIARQLAELGDRAETRKEGWVGRSFPNAEAAWKMTSGLRRALGSLGYSLRVGGPVDKPDGSVRMQYRASKTRPRVAKQEPTEAVPA